MKWSVRTRVSGGEIGSHDTTWDQMELQKNGWLRVWSMRPATEEEQLAAYADGDTLLNVITDERWYPPTSVYSVKPITP
jgi:hypothetical protein